MQPGSSDTPSLPQIALHQQKTFQSLEWDFPPGSPKYFPKRPLSEETLIREIGCVLWKRGMAKIMFILLVETYHETPKSKYGSLRL